MFDHVRGDQLDQRKYPWISLTQAAIYLMSPDDAERLRAVNSHDWKRPFEHLREWIEDGKLTVYDFNRSQKKSFSAFRSDTQVTRMTDEKTLDALTNQASARSLNAIYCRLAISTLKARNTHRNGVI